ncbi:hypothetical protein F5B21DRAFT_493964 [Xylaria acuta]|nr:hypothetical protein F5B21DRAFT_493964 [Xylaria acuta]
MAPIGAKTSDLVVVVIGAQTPFVLRRTNDNKRRLLGEACCCMAIDGEIPAAREEAVLSSLDYQT